MKQKWPKIEDWWVQKFLLLEVVSTTQHLQSCQQNLQMFLWLTNNIVEVRHHHLNVKKLIWLLHASILKLQKSFLSCWRIKNWRNSQHFIAKYNINKLWHLYSIVLDPSVQRHLNGSRVYLKSRIKGRWRKHILFWVQVKSRVSLFSCPAIGPAGLTSISQRSSQSMTSLIV